MMQAFSAFISSILNASKLPGGILLKSTTYEPQFLNLTWAPHFNSHSAQALFGPTSSTRFESYLKEKLTNFLNIKINSKNLFTLKINGDFFSLKKKTINK